MRDLARTLTRRFGVLGCAAGLLGAAIAPAAVAQSPGQVDPLTGKVVQEAEPAEPEETAPSRADLSEANERVRAQDYTGADSILAVLQESFADDPARLFMRGEVLLALNRPADALPHLRRASELDPTRPRLHFQLGAALAATGDADGAIRAFGQEIELSEEPQVIVLSRLNRSMLLQQKKDWNGASEELEAVLVTAPDRVQVYGDLATLRLQAGDPDGALAVLERGSAAGFGSAQHYYSAGARFYKLERYEDAVGALTRALELDPGLARAERSLAAALEQLGRQDEAVAHLERYLEIRPDAPDAAKIAEQIKAARGD